MRRRLQRHFPSYAATRVTLGGPAPRDGLPAVRLPFIGLVESLFAKDGVSLTGDVTTGFLGVDVASGLWRGRFGGRAGRGRSVIGIVETERVTHGPGGSLWSVGTGVP